MGNGKVAHPLPPWLDPTAPLRSRSRRLSVTAANLLLEEVISMTRPGRWKRAQRSVEYWAKWTLLSLFGPAQQDREQDPIEILRREYGRPPRSSN